MNRELLSEKISRLTSILSAVETDVDPSILDRFQNGLLTLNGWQTFRVNPLSLAEAFGIERRQILKLFVYGVKAGLFTFEWNLLCPFCGGREHSHANLNQLEKDFYHCTTCDVDVDVTADDHLEISFTIVPEVSEFVADPLRSLEDYRRYYYSPYFVPSQAYKEALEQSPPVRFANLKPGARALVKIGNTPTGKHRFFSLATHSVFTTYLNVANAGHSGKLSITHDGIEFSQKEAQVDRGPAEVIVSNASGTPLGFLVSSPDSKQIAAAIQEEPPVFREFVTGRMMLNNQPFRELYLVDNLPNELSLRVKDITLMFTDLKGSTEMYQFAGDARAYGLVKEHFSILQRMVQENEGAIVKTMGDAIMASFSSPSDAVSAAIRMLEKIAEFNQSADPGLTIGLKLGIHRGAVIAVKANQTLDYFGQTVNIAARVQALSQSGEIHTTEDVLQEDEVRVLFARAGFSPEARSETLKGVKNPIPVVRFRKAAGSLAHPS